MEQELQQNNPHEPKTVSGWLAFFLWVGVGLGAVIGCVRNIVELVNIGWTPISVLIFAGYLGPMVAVAVMTIVAFYKRQPNAVALAIMYIVMIALDGVLQLALYALMEEAAELKGIIRSFVWAVVWFIYLMVSQQVKELIPEETRSSKLAEKILMAVYIVAMVSLFMGLKSMVQDPMHSFLVTKRYLIQSSIDEANAGLPTNMGGFYLEKIEMEGSSVNYKYRFRELSVADLNMDYIYKHSLAHRQEVLQSLAEEKDPDMIDYYQLIFDNGYNISHCMMDKDYLGIYTVTVTPEDYVAAADAGSAFRCEREAWDEAVSLTKAELPMEYMGDCFLKDVTVDHEAGVLRYDVALPEMDDFLVNLFFTEEYVRDYFSENDLSDYLWRMAVIDEMDIHYHFVTYKDRELKTVVFTPEEYSQYL